MRKCCECSFSEVITHSQMWVDACVGHGELLPCGASAQPTIFTPRSGRGIGMLGDDRNTFECRLLLILAPSLHSQFSFDWRVICLILETQKGSSGR